MKIKKLITISSIILSLAVITTSVVFAAYIFNKNIGSSDNVNVGQISVDTKSFVNYQDANNKKFRTDTVAKVDDILLTSDEKFIKTTDTTFQSNKIYYQFNLDNTLVVGAVIDANTYYELVGSGVYSLTQDKTVASGKNYYKITSPSIGVGAQITGDFYNKDVVYTGIKKIGKVEDASGNTFTTTFIDNIITIKKGENFELSLECEFNSLGLKKVSPNITSYRAVIDSDYFGFIVIDTTIKGGNIISNKSSVTCSATEEALDENNIYLNQLGLEFSFTNQVAVYARIHIQDAWITTKIYSTNRRENYSIKDQIAGHSPFELSNDDWYYNSSENTLYFKQMIMPEKNEDGSYKEHSYSFMLNEAYYYILGTKTNIYKEYVNVEVSFSVDLVQANRAQDLWKIDPSKLGGND